MEKKKQMSQKPYLPKRSTVLLFCFILSVFLSAQYHILDGIMETLVRDEVAGEFLKTEQFMLEAAVHLGYLISGPITGAFVVVTGKAKATIVTGFLISCLAIFYTPIASSDLYSMMWARLITGTGIGMVVVSMFQFIAIWIPKNEYTRAVTFIGSGYYAGMLFSDLWGSVLTKVYSWQATFYWFSVIPLLFLVFWSYVIASSPSKHSKITSTELSYLKANAISPEGHGLLISQLIQRKIVWVLFICSILFQFSHMALFSTIQYFIVDILWIDISFAVLIIIFLYYNISAIVFDYLLQLDKSDSTGKNNHKLREAVGCVGSIGCAIFLKLFCGSSHSLTIRLMGFGIALALLSCSYVGHVSALFDVIPRQCAFIVGLSLFPSGLLNIWAHIGLRWVLDSTGNWSFVLSSIAAGLSLYGLIWGIFGDTTRILN